MTRSRLAVVVAIVLAFGLVLSATTVTAQEAELKDKAPPTAEELAKAPSGYDVVGCRQLYVEDAGYYKMSLPRWCRNGRCEIFGEWWGEPAGAYTPGLTVSVNFIQLPDIQQYWSAGPAISLGGITTSGGWGNNGDQFQEVILGPYMTADGSYFELIDDVQGIETEPNRVTFALYHNNANNKQITAAKIYICKGSKGG